MDRRKIENLKIMIAIVYGFVVLPHCIIFNIHKNKPLIIQDLKRWLTIHDINLPLQIGFIYTLLYFPNFRNVFYKRAGSISRLICLVCPQMKTLHIVTANAHIGGGLYIEHGFSTIITAKYIGKNAWINQQVTIGFKNNSSPTIGDNVKITCGAKVLGGIRVGDHCIIGANAVVIKDVPEKSIVGGVPARIIGRVTD